MSERIATEDRRPIASRDRRVFQKMAGALAHKNVSPNAVSVSSMLFAALACAALALTDSASGVPQRILFLAGAFCIQCRLLANMLDGMVAMNANQSTPIGGVYNEAPDRVSDCLILIGLGLAAGGDLIAGLGASIAAQFVAYIRALGASLGVGQAFHGPMAKPQRMFVCTAAAVCAAALPANWQPSLGDAEWGFAAIALAIVVIGGALTALRRTLIICARLRETAE